jgi:hypothetical protein
MIKTPNEIALEQTVVELKREITELKKFELEVSAEVARLMVAIIANNPGMGEEAFKKLGDIVSERAKQNILKGAKK